MPTSRSLLVPFVAALLTALVGCDGSRGGKASITRLPEWEYQAYKRVAVVAGKPAVPQAAADTRMLADRLETLLSQSHEFAMLSRDELGKIYQEQDLSKLVDAVDEGTALPEGKIQVAQALVIPRITDYKLIHTREERVIPRFVVDPQGRRRFDRYGRPLQTAEEHVVVYTNGAEVEGSVRVVDAATGKILLSHTTRIAPHPRTNYGRPPSQTPEMIASQAVEELAREFFNVVAPVRVRVDLKAKMLLVATDYYDGRYDDTTKLASNLPEFLVAVHDLPESADRNDFRVTITEEGGRENLFEQRFTWSGSAGPEGVSYRVPMEALTKTAGTKFVAKLYSGDDPVPRIERKFTLVVPKEK
jgi:hypothetical protein